MDSHIRLKHAEYASPSNRDDSLKRLPKELWDDMRTTVEEEVALGIPVEFRWSAFTHFVQPVEDEGDANIKSCKRTAQSQGGNRNAKRARRGG